MSKEIDHGHYQEFKRTPQEKRMAEDRRRIEELERRVSCLEKELEELRNDNELRILKKKRK